MARSFRPLHPDFRAFALANTANVTRLHFNLGSTTYRRWLREAGIAEELGARPVSNEFRPLPPDFAEYATAETNEQLALRYGSCGKTVSRWRSESGVHRRDDRRHRLRPVPADFKEVASNMARVDLMLRYATSEKVLRRWIRETDATPARFVRRFHRRGPVAAPVTPDSSFAARAAQHLQRLMPVFKKSTVHPGADGYVVGGRTMTTEAMVEMARAKGWNPAAWRLAA